MTQLQLFKNGHSLTATETGRRRIDLIYTDALSSLCCVAVRSGFLYGLNSSEQPCDAARNTPGHYHRVSFLDNDYFNYDHGRHLAVAEYWQPRYVTVRDAMTPEQCLVDGIKYYPLDQILKWADELSKHAERVIVIPKYDCLSEIPGQYMLGYSIQTSNGGTDIPIERFSGRQVHLLGGSWKKQLAYYSVIPNDVVSIDNNHVSRVAQHGGVFFPDGRRRELHQMGLGGVSNPAYVASIISLGHMAAAIKEMENYQ